jgi:nucleoid-associated protein YejK
MNLVTWFKGLGVFVLSSCVTALATMTLDPASFNFSRSGLVKLATSEAVTTSQRTTIQHCQLDQSERRAGSVRGLAGKRVADWLREFMGANDLCFVGRQQGFDRLRRGRLQPF